MLDQRASKIYELACPVITNDLPRTNIAVDDGVATALADEATRFNKTLYGFSNECLEADLKILREGGNVEGIYPYWLQSKMSKETDGMPFLNRSLLDMMAKMSYATDPEACLKIFFDTGILFGSYAKLRAKDLDNLLGLVNLVKFSIPARLFEMQRKEGEDSKMIYVLRYVSGMSNELTICMAHYFDGLLSCYSSTRKLITSSSGVIEIEIKPD